MKTQSLVVSTSNLTRGYNKSRQNLVGRSRDEETKKRHLQSTIVIEPKHRRDESNDQFNPKHHSSVVVFNNHPRNFVNPAEAIGPQRTKL